jgi:hypothetical protein
VRVVKTLNGALAKGCDGFGAQELLGDFIIKTAYQLRCDVLLSRYSWLDRVQPRGGLKRAVMITISSLH